MLFAAYAIYSFFKLMEQYLIKHRVVWLVSVAWGSRRGRDTASRQRLVTHTHSHARTLQSRMRTLAPSHDGDTCSGGP